MIVLQILGSGMSARMWDVTVEHARTCISNEVHVYYPDNQRKTGVVFSTFGEALGTFSEQQFHAVNGLTSNERVCIFRTAYIPTDMPTKPSCS